MTGLQRPLNFMSATIADGDREHTLEYLSFASVDGGVFGRTSTVGFLVDGKVNKAGTAQWADALLSAGRGVVKIEGQPRVSYSVTFRIADGGDERAAAWARIREVRPAYNARMDSGEVRIILMELDDES